MSTTDIYCLGPQPREIGSIRNAFRAGMYVWTDIAKRYFDLPSFPMFNEPQRNEVWNAEKHRPLEHHEVIVLRSTMDGSTVKADQVTDLIEAFRTYGKEHPASSYSEQADMLAGQDFKPGDLIAWRQTSVAELWGIDGEDEETGDLIWYDPETGTKHWDVLSLLPNTGRSMGWPARSEFSSSSPTPD